MARLDRYPALLRLRTPWVVGGLVAAKVVMAATVWLGADVWSRLPDPESFRGLDEMPEATILYDRFDRPIFTIFEQQRLLVPLEEVSPLVISAVLAIEDRRFYDHAGVDVVRVGGAAVANLTARRIVQGGSTITQQLARQSLLSTDRTWGRKLAEVLTAVRIERAYVKEEILSLYLNRIYFGDGFYGVEAAAQGYFGKAAADLTLAEASLLAGLIQAPERYSPTKHPDRALARRDVVLDAMLDAGFVDRGAVETARHQTVVLSNGLSAADRFGGYFKEEVRRQLVDLFGWDEVATAGLRVFTTIDPQLQRAAEASIEQGIGRVEARKGYRHPRRDAGPVAAMPAAYLQGALIALDPRTGEVRAVVGGRDFEESSFNRATQARRQPGSAFKPFVFAAALEAGLTPATILQNLHEPMPTPEGDWLPADGHVKDESLSLRRALRLSSNRAAVKVGAVTGLSRTVASVSRFNLGTQPAVPSLPLGPGEVTLEAMTAAYAAFANGGMVPRPFYLRRVESARGERLFDAQPTLSRAVNPGTAFQMASLLADVVDAGTGYRVRTEGFTLPAGGKTGTTNDSNDVWFVGFTPSLAAGVWLGFDAPQTIVRNGYAADLAAPVWAGFMKAATRGAKQEWLTPPPEITSAEVCWVSGALATDQCRNAHLQPDAAEGARRVTYVEYFVRGTEPLERCSVHQAPALFRLIAGVFKRGEKTGDDAGAGDGELVAVAEDDRPSLPTLNVDIAARAVEGEALPGELVPDETSVAPEESRSNKRSFWRRLLRFGL